MPLTLKLPLSLSLALIIFTPAVLVEREQQLSTLVCRRGAKELGRKIYFEFVLHANWKLDCVHLSSDRE